jgi:hypothetical protein
MTKPIEGIHCEDCRHAIVGSGEVCRCERGHWAEIPLDAVARIGRWLRCRVFEGMEG